MNKAPLSTKSLFISRAVSNFYGTEIEIWAGFGPVGSTEKKLDWLWATFEGGFFRGKIKIKFFWKYCSVRTKKWHNISFIKRFFFWNFEFFFEILFWLKIVGCRHTINCGLLYYLTSSPRDFCTMTLFVNQFYFILNNVVYHYR